MKDRGRLILIDLSAKITQDLLKVSSL